MENQLLQVGKAQAQWNSAGSKILKYTVELFHHGLNEHKLISAPDLEILQNKANLQAKKWDDQWNLSEQKRINSEMKDASIELAAALTEEACNSVARIENLLVHTLSVDDTVDWEKLKRNDDFPELLPTKPAKKNLIQHPEEPKAIEIHFTFLEKLFKSKKERRVAKNDDEFRARVRQWENEKQVIEARNIQLEGEYDEQVARWQEEVESWDSRKQNFLLERAAYNQRIDSMKNSYLSQDQESIV